MASLGPEAAVQAGIRLAVGGRPDIRLWRNNTGMAWTGEATRIGPDVLLRNARPLRAGLCTGSLDLIGLRAITISEYMLGQTIGVFLAIDAKSPDRPRTTEEQERFIELVQRLGGLAGTARSVEEARLIAKI